MLGLQLRVGIKGILGTEAATQVATTDDFYYEPKYKLLICKKHKRAVQSLDGHLRDAHGLKKKKERLPLLDRYKALLLAKPEDVLTP